MKEFEKVLEEVLKEIKTEVLPKIKLKEPIIYYGARKGLGTFLGFNYSDNKTKKPIIKLNCNLIIRESKRKNTISMYDIILTTILHELAHALQLLKGKEFNEQEAEDFAYYYWDWKEITAI
jgi:DNA-directed RNA polymerase subunit H (RpoH/RPB5)